MRDKNLIMIDKFVREIIHLMEGYVGDYYDVGNLEKDLDVLIDEFYKKIKEKLK